MIPELALGGVIGFIVAKNVNGKTVLTIQPPTGVNDASPSVKSNQTYYQLVNVDLSTARNGLLSEVFNYSGDYMIIYSLSGSAEIIFNEPENAPLPLIARTKISTPFYRFFIKNSAQVGKKLTLIIGRGQSFDIDFSGSGLSVSGIPQVIFDEAFGALPAGTYYSTMVNASSSQRLVLFITNTLNVAVTVQAAGQVSLVVPAATNIAYISVPKVVAALTGINSIGITDVYWHPFICCEIVVPAGAAAGSLKIEAVTQN